MAAIRLIPKTELDRVRDANLDQTEKLTLFASMCRVNALSIVKRAGSGHLGSSFSAMEIVTWLYLEEMNSVRGGSGADRDIYFSSKGHDCPGLYAVLFGLGVMPRERFVRLRRFGGMDGHPDVGVPGIEANSGSLGMGISKARGIAWAQRKRGGNGRAFVMLGDGELQEGQIYESLQSTVQQQVGNLVAIIDHNKVQSDKLVSEIVDLGDLQSKLRAFGWNVVRCNGHDIPALRAALAEVRDALGPKLIIADTIKGKGVSFMEHPAAMAANGGFYKWHAGAPPDDAFAAAHGELVERVQVHMRQLGLGELVLEEVADEPAAAAVNLVGEPVSAGAAARLSARAEYVADAFGQGLVELGAKHQNLVVLDADLSADCRLRGFEQAYPDRFIQNGIAEQDMVSMAGGLARHGFIPVVNSFASFLASRANEQIYNNATEHSKVIYGFHYAGMIPAGPGKSHQSIRDISLVAALPNCVVIQPCTGAEAKQALAWAVEQATDNVVLRMNIGPSPGPLLLPPDYVVTEGQGAVLVEPSAAPACIAIGYGPVLLHEAVTAAERARDVRVIDLPWLNRLDLTWFMQVVPRGSRVVVLEDHAPVGGLADFLRRTVPSGYMELEVFGVDGYPACGTPVEALAFHRLDAASLVRRFAAAGS